MKRCRLKWAVALATLALALALATSIVAGAEYAVEISPSTIDLTLEPGAERTVEIQVFNTSDSQELTLDIRLSPVLQDRGGGYSLTEDAGPLSAVPWLALGLSGRVTIPPGWQQVVPVKIRVPRGASGTKAAAVVFAVVPQSQRGQVEFVGGTSFFIHQLTSVLKVTANSRTNRRAASLAGIQVTSGRTDKLLAGRYGQAALAVSALVTNEGNTAFVGKGTLIIRNPAGRRVKEVPLGAGRGIVMPGATVAFTSVFLQGLPEGEYTAEVTLRYGGARPLQARLPFTAEHQGAAAGEAELAPTVHLEVGPPEFQAQLPPGAFRSFTLTLTNREPVRLRLRALAKGLAVTEEGDFLPTEEAPAEWLLVPYVTAETEAFVLEPGERKNLRVTVRVPKEAPDGTRYAAIVLEAEKETAQPGTVTTLSTPVMVTVGKKLERKAELSDPGIQWSEASKVLIVSAELVNRGNTHLTPSGRVVLRRRPVIVKGQGDFEYIGEAAFEDLATAPLLDVRGPVLPGTSRLVFASYDQPLEPGEYQAEITVEFGGELPAKGVVSFVVAAEDNAEQQSDAKASSRQ